MSRRNDHFSTNCYVWMILSMSMLCLTATRTFSQTETKLKSKEVIRRFIDQTGGGQWRKLKSRQESSFVDYEEDKEDMIRLKSYDMAKLTNDKGQVIETHQFLSGKASAMVFGPDCSWFYSNNSETVTVLSSTIIKYRTDYPRTTLMEILNLEARKEVYAEDTLYRVDFVDTRMKDDTHSLYFGQQSGLLYKRKYINKNGAVWEYCFSEYKEHQGFMEPYVTELRSEGNMFFTVRTDIINYNVIYDDGVFTPPFACNEAADYESFNIVYEIPILSDR